MNHLRCFASWLLYWIGHALGWLMNWLPLYRAYNWCMCKSAKLDTGDCNLWFDVPPEQP